jgi:exodeoxyribonuclease V beta subunit
MADHHYPLQALLYGAAVFRLLRWRLPEANPDTAIVGVLYAFVRGMLGSNTPADSEGRRSGVFFWKPPAGLWQQLSDLLSPAPLAGGRR